jgi:hypothetical protein
MKQFKYFLTLKIHIYPISVINEGNQDLISNGCSHMSCVIVRL